MAISFGDIAGQEPSTVTFRVETVVVDRNGTNVNREVLVFGDPETSNAVARVVAAAPDSTHFGAVVRQVGYSTVVSVSTGSVRVHQSSAADLNVTVAGYSTVATISTGSVRVHQSSAADLNVTVAGYSTTVNVSSLAGPVIVRSSAADALITAYQSTYTAFNGLMRLADRDASTNVVNVTNTDPASTAYGLVVRTVGGGSTVVSVSTGSVRVHQSSAADLNVTVSGYSTTANVSSLAGRVAIAGFHAGAGIVNVTDSTETAIRVNVVAGAAAGSTVVTVSTGSVRVHQSSAADLQATVTQASTTWQVQANGMAAHGAAVGGNPMQAAGGAVAHGANPSAVAAGQVTRFTANRAGVQFTIGGHPNIITTEYLWTTAQTDDIIVSASSGTKIVVTQAQVGLSADGLNTVGFRIGFSSATLPTAPTDGTAVAGYVLSHGGLVPGAGWNRGDGSGILGIGGDDEDLRITASSVTTGNGRAVISYFTIES